MKNVEASPFRSLKESFKSASQKTPNFLKFFFVLILFC